MTMNKAIKANRTPKPAKKPKALRKSLGELNAWMSANHDGLLEKARRNCIALTGRETFGGRQARKSA
jgi:hypothetical protein